VVSFVDVCEECLSLWSGARPVCDEEYHFASSSAKLLSHVTLHSLSSNASLMVSGHDAKAVL
jgi:hypothetical protein